VKIACPFVFFVSILFNLVTVVLNRIFFDPEEQKKLREMYAEYMELMKEAKATGDKRLQAKVKRRQQAMASVSGKIASQNLKMMVVSMVIFGTIFSLLGAAFNLRPAALLPFSLSPSEKYVPIPMFYWYLICSFAIARPLQKILGIQVGLAPPTQPSTR
ncbi:DUF4199 family protein, partial [Candidatus Bathyarchaeota archaeon]|nr:DUF4199 family protein [Candidatus Bathyarchaeota archaeon]